MAAPAMTKLAARKILWVEDIEAVTRGYVKHFRRLGHVIETATSYEAAVSALSGEAFDLLVVDQQLPYNGKKTDEAGSLLVDALYRGSFGELNSRLPFLFYTASEDWVLNAKIDVTGLSGYLDIEEKGDDITGALEERLEQVPAEALAASRRDDEPELQAGQQQRRPKADSKAGGEAGVGKRPPVAALADSEEWRGVVMEIGTDTLRARLSSDRPLPDYEVWIPVASIAREDLELLAEGAEFVWLLEICERESGERVTESRLSFLRPTPISMQDIEEARARVRERRASDA